MTRPIRPWENDTPTAADIQLGGPLPTTPKENPVIDTVSKVQVYELDGKDTSIPAPVIEARSVRPWSERVCLVIDGHCYVVIRRDLEAALAATAHTGGAVTTSTQLLHRLGEQGICADCGEGRTPWGDPVWDAEVALWRASECPARLRAWEALHTPPDCQPKGATRD